jgi:Flp pilus assembly protein TadG
MPILNRFARNRAGVAAIEFALILPIMVLLFLGLVDVTALISDNRKVSYSANLVADLVTRLDTPTTPARIADSFRAVDLVMRGAQAAPARVEIYNYRNQSNAMTLRWRRDNGTGAACGGPNVADLVSLTAAGNDIVVAVVCLNHVPIISRILDWDTLGAATFRLREQIAMRPRESLALECPTC